MKILFTGGGTAGHIIPLIAVAREIRHLYDKTDLQLHYMGPKDAFVNLLLLQEGIRVSHSTAGKIRRDWGITSLFSNLVDMIVWLPLGILQAFWKLFFLSPDIIFSKGGYGSVPVVVAGWLLRTPIFLHESDGVPGKANRFCAAFALQIFTSFPRTVFFSQRKIIDVGNPIRRKMLDGTRQEAIRLFDLKADKALILILGGSQGAQKINDLILAILPEMVQTFEIIHQIGEQNFSQTKREADVMLQDNLHAPYYHPVSFLRETELKHAYAAADAVVSRAGSSAIFEIAAFNKPSIVIPLPNSAQNHQIENAYAYAQNGATIVLEETNLSPHFFLERLKYIVFTQEETIRMAASARSFAKPEAAHIIAEYMVDYLVEKK